MNPASMDELIETHIAAEIAGDSTGAVAVYTDDVEHDVVGWPTGAARGPAAAQGFYDALMAEFVTETMERTRAYYGEGFCVTEHQTTGTVPGAFWGVPGNGRRARMDDVLGDSFAVLTTAPPTPSLRAASSTE